MKITTTTLTLALTTSLMLASHASANPFTTPTMNPSAPANNYIGASVGKTSSKALCDNLAECDESDYSYKAYSGVRLNNHVIIEAGYLKSGETLMEDKAGNRAISKLSGYTGAVLATYQYNQQIEVFGKGGLLWWESEYKTADSSQTNSGTNAFIGVGANYDLGDNIGIRAEWERFEGIQQNVEKQPGSVDLLSVGVTLSSL